MQLKSDTEINELIYYVKWNEKFKTDDEAISWLDKYIPNWREAHDTKITYSEQIGTDK